MKRFTTGLFTLFLITNICFSQSGWFWQNPLPTNSTINDILFINQNTGFITGSCNLLMKTTNSGLNWIRKNLPSSGYKIQFENSIGFIKASGKLLKSTDYGENWNIVYENDIFSDFYFVDSNTGYLTGGYFNKFYKTTDSGSNWVYISDISNCFSIFFVNQNTGYAAGRGLLKTTNGGLNWIQSIPLNYWYDIKDIFFLNEMTGYAAGEGQRSAIYKTTNGGQSWDSTIYSSTYDFHEIHFGNVNYGVIAGGNHVIDITTNGGGNWSLHEMGYSLYTAFVIDQNTFYTGGYGGIIIETTNFGNTWNNLRQGPVTNLRGIFSIDTNNLFIVGDTGTVLKTSNGGTMWSWSNSGINSNLNSIFFTSLSTGYIAANAGYILKTSNYGVNWINLNSGVSNDLISVKFMNDNTGYILASNIIILKTTNQGLNWNQLNIGLLSQQQFQFINSNTGFVVGSNKIVKTTNGGYNWNESVFTCEGNCTISLADIFFLNDTIGYACGKRSIFIPPYQQESYNITYRTTNGGNNWYEITSPPGSGLSKIFFTDINTGYLFDLYNLFKTTTGGLQWLNLVVPCGSYSNINFINAKPGYLIGGLGTIVKIVGGGIVVSSKNTQFEIPFFFSLSQNYPNPFNPITKIKYDIPPSSERTPLEKGAGGMMVQLIIYDVLGREIETLVNETQKPGSYEVQWDGSKYASGVYFYKLMTEEWTETKKMVLIK